MDPKKNGSTEKKKYPSPIRLKLTPKKVKEQTLTVRSNGKIEKLALPIPLKILEKMFEDEKPKRKSIFPSKSSTSRCLLGGGPSKTNDLGVRPLTSVKKPTKSTRQSVNPICTARKTLFGPQQSTSRRTIKPLTPKQPTTRVVKSFLPKVNPPSSTKTLPTSGRKIVKPKIAEPAVKEPTLPRQKLMTLKRNLQSALEIVESLMEFATEPEEEILRVSQETQTNFSEDIVPSKHVPQEDFADENKENEITKGDETGEVKENDDAERRKSTPKKQTPRRSLRLSKKLERTLSEDHLELEGSTGLTSKSKSDSEDSFMKLENELNIIHDKKETRKTFCGSLRELAILQSSRSNTPATLRVLRTKSVLNTPRIGRSRNAMKQLQSLLTDSPI